TYEDCMSIALLDAIPIVFGAQNDDAAAAAGALGFLCFGAFYLVLLVLGMALGIANLYFNFKALDKLPVQFRQMEPYQVFFLLIPIFQVVWAFFVFTKVP